MRSSKPRGGKREKRRLTSLASHAEIEGLKRKLARANAENSKLKQIIQAIHSDHRRDLAVLKEMSEKITAKLEKYIKQSS